MEVIVNLNEIMYYNQPLYGYCHTDEYGKKVFFVDQNDLDKFYIYDTDFIDFNNPIDCLKEIPILCSFYENETLIKE